MNPFKPVHSLLRWFRRVWWKVLLAVLGVVGLLVGLLLYGLRYGFVPLPKPPPGFTLNYPPPGAIPLEQATNGWAVLTRVQWSSASTAPDGDGILDQLPDDNAIEWLLRNNPADLLLNQNVVTITNLAEFCRLIEADLSGAITPDELAALLKRPEEFPSPMPLPPLPHQDEFWRVYELSASLRTWNAVLAGRAVEQGRLDEALDRLVTGFVLDAGTARSLGSYPRFSSLAPMVAGLVAISTAPLDPEHVRARLAALDQAARSFPSLADLYQAAVALQLPGRPDCWLEDPDYYRSWSGWFSHLHGELGSFWDKVKALPTQVWLKACGSNRDPEWPHFDFDDVGGTLLQALAWNLARRQDLERTMLATAAQELARIERAKSDRPKDIKAASQPVQNHLEWWTWFNQPLARVAPVNVKDVQPWAKARASYFRNYEFCRLVLALRLWRDAHGHWPDRLEALVPEWLDAIPADPVSGRPFRYRRHGAHWLMWVPDEKGHDPDVWQFRGTCLASARCLLRFDNLKWLLNQVGGKELFRGTPHLDDLLALLPKGAESISPWEFDRLMMARYGLLPADGPGSSE